MLKDFLKVWLDIEELDRSQKDISQRIDNLQEEIEDIKKTQISEERIEEVEKDMRELKPVTVDLTDRERDMLEILIGLEDFTTTNRIAEELEISTANARAVLGNLKEKIDLDQKTEGRKKLYKLSEEEKEEIFSNR